MKSNKFNFTKQAINSLELPESGKRKKYYDARVPCLELSVTDKGTMSFYHYTKINGRPERTFLGKYPRMSIEQARAKTGELNAKVSDGKNPAQDRRNVHATMTLNELFSLYGEKHGSLTKRWYNDINIYKNHLSQWDHRRISGIRRVDVQDLLVDLGKRRNHTRQANATRTVIHKLFEFATERGYDGTNPCRGIKKYPETKRKRYLQKDELPRFFDTIINDPHPNIKDFILTALFTGARSGNVQAMRWIDFDKRVWNIPESKSGEGYTVPIVDYLMDLLRERQNKIESAWVFPSLTIDSHIRDPKKQWKRICRTADIENLTLHDLRRSLGSWMAQTGSSELIIGGALGHKKDTSSVTAIYARLDIEPVRMAMERAVKAMLIHGGMEAADVIPFQKIV